MSQPIVVLHVDDDRTFAEMTRAFLERDDRFEVLIEGSADDGLDRLDRRGVDCVVSDFEMPNRDGLEFLRAVRADHGDLPFILFTGQGSETVASDAIASGATDYLRKRSGAEQYELLANRIRNAVEQHRAKAERRRNERRFRAVFEDPKMLVALLDTDGRLVQANETAMSFVEADHEAVVGEPFWETPWWSEEMRDDVKAWVERAAAGEYIEYEDSRLHPGGRPQSAHGNIRPVTEDGEVVSLIASSRDTTERRRSERRFGAVFNNVSRCVALADPSGTLLAVNDPALAAVDADRADLVGTPLREGPWFGSDGAAAVDAAVETASQGRTVREELVVDGTDGTRELSLTPVTDDDGTVTLLVGEWDAPTDR